MKKISVNEVVKGLCGIGTWAIRYLTIYSVMLIVNALSMGVANGYILLVCAMVWLGCCAGHILLVSSGRKLNSLHQWILESLCLYGVMCLYNLLCGIVGVILSALQYAVEQKTENQIVRYLLAVGSSFIQLHMLVGAMTSGLRISAGLTLILMVVFHMRSWLDLHPVKDGTMHRVKAVDRQKCVMILSVLTAVEYGICLLLGMKLVRFGMLAVQQKKLFVMMEADLWIAVLLFGGAVIRYCIERFRMPDMPDMEKQTAPHLIGCMIVTALYALDLTGISHLTAGFSMLCLLTLIATLYLMYRFELLNETKRNGIMSVWSLVYMIGVFMLVYTSYNGVTVSSVMVAETAGACAVLHLLWSRKL
ncbi:MAG: hypothetical protein ACI32N_04865 [Bulleidia sp.]